MTSARHSKATPRSYPMIPLGTVICSARLTPGAITQRVAHVGRPTRDARRLIRSARKIRLEQQRGEAYRTICVSLYDSNLAALDELVARAKQAGATQASRSALIRVALKQLDLDAVLRQARSA